ncbi:MAG: hypothetical protein AB1414_21535, partial [bacterium]
WGAYDGTNAHIYYSTSSDGITWSGHTLAINHGVVTDASVYAYDPSVIKDGSTYKMWWGAYDGTNYHIYYSKIIDNYSTLSTFESSIMDLASAYPGDLLVLQADVPTGTSLTVSARAGDTATPDASWTAWDTSPPFSPGSNPQILVHQIGVSGTHRYWQYKIEGVTDGLNTWIVRDVVLIPQPSGYSRLKSSSNVQDVEAGQYYQYLVFGASNGTAVWELDKVDLLSHFTAFDLSKRYQIASVSLTDPDDTFYRIHYSLNDNSNFLSIPASSWNDLGDKTASNTLSHTFPGLGQALRWVRFNQVTVTGTNASNPKAIAFLASQDPNKKVYRLCGPVSGDSC